MTDKPAVNHETNSNGGPVAVTNVSGGVNLAAERVNIGQDVVSGDKYTVGGPMIRADTVIVGAGLTALRELMQHSDDVRVAVIAFQTDFQAAREQIDQLGDYKDLHDLLHRLQFNCYNAIVYAAPHFPDDESTLEALTDYAQTLEDIAAELRRVAARPQIPKQETVWIDDVDLAKADLASAIGASDEKLLKRVIWRLNRLLSTRPARINTLLNYTAQGLRLPALTNALARIWDYLMSLDLDPHKVGQFQTGVDALRQLNHNLTMLLDEHVQWQTLDVELRRIEGTLEHDLVELEMSWPDVKARAGALYLSSLEDWALNLKKEDGNLDDALAASNPVKAKRSFRSFQRLATVRFHNVDKDLQSLCGDLRTVGVPLASVLRMIE